MKRDIACPNCALTYHGYPDSIDGPAEYIKRIKGKANLDFICDRCGKPILKDSDCVAISVYSDLRPYFRWEGDYVTE